MYEPTRKQFYNQYLCRMVINCPGGRLIYNKDDDLTTALAHRINFARTRNWGGSWMNHSDHLAESNIDQIANLKSIREDFEKVTKFRVEEPSIQIYTEDEDTLREIAMRILPEFQSEIQLIQMPSSDEHTDLLKEGKILTKPSSKIAYRYKIMLRDGTYDATVRQQILNYIINLGEDEAKASAGTLHKLERHHSYLWGAFIYVNDMKILTFLNLICPSMVLNIHELAKVEE